ncbi:MAG: endonuclease MutS2 [Anaerolineales bacterium]|nr:endonuclease MutS2 [Anaerolineales bacterium]MCS7247018.1 endonuclease MutS2 [Anaerolineales bacterium]MDW8160829.1 endonuclease MutS2 [Anaerolineales bacterium]MDW8446815.1 endonuclease MutS2 [Anaerolineales bacterium]
MVNCKLDKKTMDEKTLKTLDFPKILEQIASFTTFRPAAELALSLRPLTDSAEILRRHALIQEGMRYLSKVPQAGIGEAHDIYSVIDLAEHEGTATPLELLDVKKTLVAARSLLRAFGRLHLDYPNLSELVSTIEVPTDLIETISLALSDHGEILDSASPALGAIRSELRMVRERLLSRLQQMISDPAILSLLQEPLITQREGRYVIPIRTECKGRIPAIVHDQSASGATLFVEPLNVVELNNQHRQLQLEERDEERRVLFRLSKMIAANAPILKNCLSVLAQFDLVLSCAKYALKLNAVQPRMLPFSSNEQPNRSPYIFQLIQARHPLLDPQKVVPIDVELTHEAFALVITGPNTGGKTVTLKTVGLLCLMAQTGLPIPVKSATLSIFENIFADIGDEQSIEQSLSTFSGHIRNIIRILQCATPKSLVLLDELGAGTDPQEGSALARAILSYLVERRIPCLITTHHPELKVFAHVTPGTMNASVEFDIETLQPTYHLLIGLPGRSNAIAIAQRLGLPEEIIQKARNNLTANELESQDLLEEIQRYRELTRQAYQQAELHRQEAEKLHQELNAHLEKIESQRMQILENTQKEAEQLLSEVKDEIRKLRKEYIRSDQPSETLQRVADRLEELDQWVKKQTLEEKRKKRVIPKAQLLKPGDRVRLRSLGVRGTLTRINGEQVEVQVGALRIQSNLYDLLSDEEKETQLSREELPSTHFPKPKETPSWELDLRGLRVEEALETIDRYLDSALFAGLPFVRLIHGKGSGRLRQAIRAHLRNHPHILSFEAGEEQEGGEGVTIVKLS